MKIRLQLRSSLIGAVMTSVLLSLLPVRVFAAAPSYNLEIGGTGAASWDIGNIKPGDSGVKAVTLHNNSPYNSFISIWITDIVNTEGLNPGIQTGKLGDYLLLQTIFPQLATNIVMPAKIGDFPHNPTDTNYIMLDPVPPGGTLNLNWQWELPPATGNDVQGDSISFTINYALEMITPPSGGGGGGSTLPAAGEDTHTIVVALGERESKLTVNADGRLTEAFSGSFPDNSVILSFDGGTIINADGMVPDQIVVEESTENPLVPDGMKRVSPVYSITAYVGGARLEHASFTPPFRLVLKYDEKELPEHQTSIFIAYWDASHRWVQLDPPPGFIAATGQVAAFVNHFSLFTVLSVGQTTPVEPAHIELHGLLINPELTHPGDVVVIRAQLANTGGLSGESVVRIKITGLLDTTRLVKIAPGQTEEVKISVVAVSPGDYDVEIGNLSGTFKLIASPEEPGEFLYWLYIAVVAIILLFFITFLFLRRKHLQV
jgi:hypothetical protein